MLTVDRIKTVVTKHGKEYGIKNAYLFGSYAKGTATDASDVDIIIDDGGNIETLLQLSGFKNALIDDLGTNVDVLTMDGVRPRFYDLIKNERVILYGA